LSDAEPLVVDARGHRCPTPTLRLRRAAEGAAPGRRLLLLADDPMARIDVPHFAPTVGLTLVSVEAEGPLLRFLLIQGEVAPARGGG
jgi:tRNA 2-thiouridine synthesizing protein A